MYYNYFILLDIIFINPTFYDCIIDFYKNNFIIDI